MIAFLLLGVIGAVPYLAIGSVIWLIVGVMVIRSLCDAVNAVSASPA